MDTEAGECVGEPVEHHSQVSVHAVLPRVAQVNTLGVFQSHVAETVAEISYNDLSEEKQIRAYSRSIHRVKSRRKHDDVIFPLDFIAEQQAICGEPLD